MTKAVILAAGWGTRMRPLTDSRPKPALRIGGKTLIEHNLDQLTGLVEEVVLVIGYEGEKIKEEIGDEYEGMKIRYAEQKEPIGTGDAAKTALPFLDDDFLILNGDDLYKKEDLRKCLEQNPTIMVKEISNPSGFGQLICEGGKITDLVEKPAENVSNLVNIGAYYLNKDFFKKEIEKSERGEYEITDYIKNYLDENDMNCHVAESWNPASYPWNLLELTEYVLEKYEKKMEGTLEENVSLKGKVIIGEGSIVKAGTKLEGPIYIGKNCSIGPNAYVRPHSFIEDGAKVGHAVEVKNSIVGRGSKVSHLSYVGDSVLGERCNLGAGVVAANLNFDGSEVETEVKGEIIKTGRKKLGVVLGDGVKVGVNASLMPGVMVGTGATIYPSVTVKKNIKKGKIYKK